MSKQILKQDRGSTLVELLIVLIIVGIVAAIASPSFVGMYRRNQVKDAFYAVLGAIKETQRQAMTKGKVCKIDIDTSDNSLTGNPRECLLNERQIDDEITIRTNIPGSMPNIAFSHKGSTTKMGTIVVSTADTDLQKCFVIALGTGITRVGNYEGSSTGSVSATNCKPD